MTCPEKCVTVSPPLRVCAGELGTLSVQRRDKFDNNLERALSETPIVVKYEGPGALKTKVLELGTGVVEVQV